MNNFRHSLKRFFIGGDQFKKEVKRQVRLLVVFTMAFTIAFTWRQTIFDTAQSFVELITDLHGTTSLSILTSVVITVISLFFIWLFSKILMEKPDY